MVPQQASYSISKIAEEAPAAAEPTNCPPTNCQPMNCQAQCVGEENFSHQAWVDCINRCMSPGGVG
jgi:hypothetical protein